MSGSFCWSTLGDDFQTFVLVERLAATSGRLEVGVMGDVTTVSAALLSLCIPNLYATLDTPEVSRRVTAAAAFREFGKIKPYSAEKGCIVGHSTVGHLSQNAARSD